MASLPDDVVWDTKRKRWIDTTKTLGDYYQQLQQRMDEMDRRIDLLEQKSKDIYRSKYSRSPYDASFKGTK